MRSVLLVLVLLSCVLAEDWLDLDARITHKDVRSDMCGSNHLNYLAYPNLAVREGISSKDCLKILKKHNYLNAVAVSYFEGNKTCLIKGAVSKNASVTDKNGVFDKDIAVTSWTEYCYNGRFVRGTNSFAVKVAEKGFCTVQGFRLAGTEVAVYKEVATNNINECHWECTRHGVECTAFTIQDGNCTLYGDGYSVLYCSVGSCYSATKDCHFGWGNTAEKLQKADLTSSKDLLIEYIAHKDMPQTESKEVFFYEENGKEIGSLQLHSTFGKESSLELSNCSKGQDNEGKFYEDPKFHDGLMRRFIISMNSTGISVSGLSYFYGSTKLLWDDIYETDPQNECGEVWNGTEINRISFRNWEARGAMWTTVESGAGIVGLSAVIMLVWAVIMV